MSSPLKSLIISSLLCLGVVLPGCASKTPSTESKPLDMPDASMPAPPKPERQRTDPEPKADVTCTKKDDTRVLTIEEVRGGCWMMYVNKGIKKRSAWSKLGNSHCEKVRDQIRGTLVKSGYVCK